MFETFLVVSQLVGRLGKQPLDTSSETRPSYLVCFFLSYPIQSSNIHANHTDEGIRYATVTIGLLDLQRRNGHCS